MVNLSSPLEGYVYSSTVSIFTKAGDFNGAFFDVGESSLWGLTIPGDEEFF